MELVHQDAKIRNEARPYFKACFLYGGTDVNSTHFYAYIHFNRLPGKETKNLVSVTKNCEKVICNSALERRDLSYSKVTFKI